MRGLILRGAQILRPGGLSSPLDAFAGALYATHGTRRLVSTWTGPLVTVRRSNDNATMDVYAAGDGWVDMAALLAWCGSASAYVTRWWDQSGSGRHADQTTASAQPMLINTGVLITLGGRPAVSVPAGTYMTVNLAPPSIPISAIVSLSANKTGTETYPRKLISFNELTSLAIRRNIEAAFGYSGGYISALTGTPANITCLLSIVFNGSNSTIRFNGVSSYGSTGSNTPGQPIYILGIPGVSAYSLDGICGEIAIMNTQLTNAQLRSIETQLGTPRGITIA